MSSFEGNEADKLKVHIEELRNRVGKDVSDIMSDLDCKRFIIARQFNMDKVELMVKNWYEWYTKPIEDCSTPNLTPMNIATFPDAEEHIYTKFMPHSNLGYALNGNPIYWEKTGLISSRFSDIRKEITGESLTIRHIRQQEYMFNVKCKRASTYYNKDITKQVIVFNLAEVSYVLDTVALSVFKKTLVIDEAYYPEVNLYIIY